MVLRAIKEVLLSLRSAVIMLFILILILFGGAYLMPLREEFQSIHTMPLMMWLLRNPLHVTWWLWLSITILILLTINTLFCSIDSILKKRRITGWLMLISPQIIHLGFLFILFAHLMSSLGGSKDYSVITEGTIINVGGDDFIRFERIDLDMNQEGYITDWTINLIKYPLSNVEFSIKPNKPFFTKGIGVYVRDIQAYPFRAALVEISREPGAPWALIGAILFASGTVTLMVLKLRKERQRTED